MTETHPRRTFLATVASAITALAGCGESRTEGASTETGSATGTSTAELDLQEANVVGVEFEQTDDGRYTFDVTLVHDDDGEDGYANWWQVEALDGTRLGRQELSHAHGSQEFTRSAEIDVPAEHPFVVVRGHDQTHEYGGQVMLVSLDSESVAPSRQGSERQSFTDADCPG